MNYDIAIVGGGMVGASLACALANQPLRIALLDAQALVGAALFNAPSYDDRCSALTWGTRRIFAGMGLWDALADVATPIERIHVSEQGRRGITRLDRDSAGVAALGYVVPNRALGRVLYERLQRAPNVTLLAPARVTRLDPVTAQDTAARLWIERDGQEQTLSAALLVAADGGQSTLRAQLSIPTTLWDYGQSAIIANITPQYPHANVAYERFMPQGSLALLPMADQRCAAVWTVAETRVAEVLSYDDARFTHALHAAFGDRLGAFTRIGRRHSYALSLTLAQECVRPRVALIGNAARTLHPVAGQGFNLGLRDVAVLAQLISAAAHQGQDLGHTALLEEYRRWRTRDQRRIALFTDGLVRLFSNPLAPIGWMRSTGMILLDICPPIKQRFARHAMGLSGKLPRLAVGRNL